MFNGKIYKMILKKRKERMKRMRSEQEIEKMLKNLNVKELELELKKKFQERYLEIDNLGASIRLLEPDQKEIKIIESYIEMLEWVLNENTINKYEKDL